MKYLRLICLSSIVTACASDPPPPAQGGEQYVSYNDQYQGAAATSRPAGDVARSQETDVNQPSTHRRDVNEPGHNAQSIENTPHESGQVAAMPSVSASASSVLPPSVPTSAPVVADNTKINERDRSGATLTPTDQGGSEADRKMTQLVRQAVVKDDSLSFTAKNVKIITQNGKITLRGPVNTAQERTTIESAARKVAGSYQVDNLLEVKQ